MNVMEANTMFYVLLSNSSELSEHLTGRIYDTKRSDITGNECIVINTPYLDHEAPQQGYTNINIHVPDINCNVDGQEQAMPDKVRISLLTSIITNIITDACISGVGFTAPKETLMNEPSIKEHYNNVRVDWINCNK